MLLKIQEHQASWQAWRDSTLHVRVRLVGDSPHDSGATLVAGGGSRQNRSTNVADPFMVGPPATSPVSTPETAADQ